MTVEIASTTILLSGRLARHHHCNLAPYTGLPGGGAPTDVAGGGTRFASNIGVPGDVTSSTEEDLDRRLRAFEAAREVPGAGC